MLGGPSSKLVGSAEGEPIGESPMSEASIGPGPAEAVRVLMASEGSTGVMSFIAEAD